MKRARCLLYWTGPSLFCLLLYWRGLGSWFQGDDFAWLGLGSTIHGWHGLLTALFAPMAQGTIRPFSERAFFTVFYALFGLHPLPFHVLIFATQCANLVLVALITSHLTCSRMAGFWAAIFWTANSSLAAVLSWSAVYNQAMCALFVFLAFYFLLRFIETGHRKFWIWQWAAFLLGFGALEINVVYPALAAACTLARAPQLARRTMPLFIPSIAFLLVRGWVAPPPASGAYALSLNLRTLHVLSAYWQWSVGSAWARTPLNVPPWFLPVCAVVVSAALAGFAIRRATNRDFLPLFFLSWFLITIGPVLPFADHLTEYYSYLPSAGLAMLGGLGLVSAWRNSAVWKALSVAALAAYLAISLPEAYAECRWEFERSQEVKRVVLGVASAHKLHPDQAILLEGVGDDLFCTAILNHPFRLLDINNVYLAPGSEQRILPHPELGELGDLTEFVLSQEATERAFRRGEIVIYAVGGERIQNITDVYAKYREPAAEGSAPRLVDAANPFADYLLGTGWYPEEEHHRWMGKAATVKVGGPRSPDEKLYVRGYCPEVQTENGSLPVTVKVDGVPLPPVEIMPGQNDFEFVFPLPASAVGKAQMEVSVAVGRTIRIPGDARELGLAFGLFEVR